LGGVKKFIIPLTACCATDTPTPKPKPSFIVCPKLGLSLWIIGTAAGLWIIGGGEIDLEVLVIST
jgi:hypothetical protein